MIHIEAPLETVPMFVRGGAIIPTGPEMKYVGEKPVDPITFAIYPDENGSASATLYEDDGTSPAYERGVFRRTMVNAKRSGMGYAVSVSAPQGSYNPGGRRFNFVIKPSARTATVSDTGSPRTFEIR
jgi:alpha-glucosidase (family GH31 glycosyl hydrolase)